MTYEWTDLAFQQIDAGDAALFVFPLCVLFVFLVLAAQYESFSLPLAILLIVPMALLAGLVGVKLQGGDNNIFTQIGFLVLVGLASKNAILIVEFAKHLQEQGRDRVSAVLEAARLRLRPIVMTSIAFIMGVLPLVIASGAGAEVRRAMGAAVFSGMIGVTVFGLLLTPVFYVLLRRDQIKALSCRRLELRLLPMRKTRIILLAPRRGGRARRLRGGSELPRAGNEGGRKIRQPRSHLLARAGRGAVLGGLRRQRARQARGRRAGLQSRPAHRDDARA